MSFHPRGTRRPKPETGVHAFAGGRGPWHALSEVSTEGRMRYLTRCGVYVEARDLLEPGAWPLCPACQRLVREDTP